MALSRFLLVLALLCGNPGLTATDALLLASLPAVEQVYPQSVTVGETVLVSIEGNFLDQARNLRLEGEALTGEIIESSFTRAKIRVSAAPGAKPGLYGLRLVTRRGASNQFHLRVTGWKTVPESEPNDRPDQAQTVAPGTSVSGIISEVNDSDFYRFRARAGEVLAFNLLIGRNGYATGGEIGHFTITLLEAGGRVLASDFGRFLMDPYLRYRFEAEDDYLLVVNHSRLAVTCLENECDRRRVWEPYQLVIGRSPLLVSLWPPAGQQGTTMEAELAADFIDASMPLQVSGTGVEAKITSQDKQSVGRYRVQIQIAPDAEPGTRLFSVPDSSGTSTPLAFVVFDHAFTLEAEPNDTFDKSPLLNPPAVIIGRMDHRRDVDSFHLTPTGNEALAFRLTARNLGSAMVDPHLVLVCKEGDLSSLGDDDPSFRNPRNRDAYLAFRVADVANCANREDGFYVQVRDSSTHSGESRFYIFTATQQKPSFELGMRSDRIALQRGRTNRVPVNIRRLEGFAGDVTVTLEGLPPGLDFKPLVVSAAAGTGNLEIKVPADASETTFTLQIYGSAEIGGKKVTRPLTLPQPMLGDGPGYVQTAVAILHASVVPLVPFALERLGPPGGGFALDRHKLLLGGDRIGRILVKVSRAESFTAPLQFSVEGLPEGVILDGQVASGQEDVTELQVKANDGVRVPTGEYKITVYASAEGAVEAARAFFLRVEK